MSSTKFSSYSQLYTAILHEELIPATGCTEPIALSYAGSLIRKTLGELPQRLTVELSGSIIKNVKSVVVPHTGSRRGINIAIAAGVVAGNAQAELEVLAQVQESDIPAITSFSEACPVAITVSDRPEAFYIGLSASTDKHSAFVEIRNHHTNVTKLVLDGRELYADHAADDGGGDGQTDRSVLCLENIYEYVQNMPLQTLEAIIRPVISFNSRIADEGLKNNWGAQIGRTMLSRGDSSINNRLKALAAAGSDARMSGCEQPVVIVSGSGNQGLATSLPVIEYARLNNSSDESLIRALTLAFLITIHQKSSIGTLSAFCGAVSAACGAACGIAYLDGCELSQIESLIQNTLAIAPGMVCDGAKPSCAAKIAVALEAGLTGYEMLLRDTSFWPGDGILGDDAESTIANVGRLAKDGMYQTNREILSIMTE